MAINVTENIREIAGRRSVFHLREPIDLETRRERGRYTVVFEPLEIDVYGDDRDDAIKAFAEAFEDAWFWLTEAPAREYTRDAKVLRRRIEELVESVEPQA